MVRCSDSKADAIGLLVLFDSGFQTQKKHPAANRHSTGAPHSKTVKTKNQDPKELAYQDYVIKDGKLVGKFEEMYRNCDDPWELQKKQPITESIILHILRQMNCRRVLEVGCGFGRISDQIRAAGIEVLGVDVAPTAIAKARALYPETKFEVGDLLDFDRYRAFKADVIVLSQITWYVLDKLDAFLEFMRTECPRTRLLHVLTIYAPGVQKYGVDKFTDEEGIRRYFGKAGMRFLEWGELYTSIEAGNGYTYFLGEFTAECGR